MYVHGHKYGHVCGSQMKIPMSFLRCHPPFWLLLLLREPFIDLELTKDVTLADQQALKVYPFPSF